MKVELNSWQIVVLETLVQRELNNFCHPDDKDSAYVRSLGGLLNVLAMAKPSYVKRESSTA